MDDSKKECTFDFCDRDQYSKKLCNAHYNQQRMGKELKPLRGSRILEAMAKADASCKLTGCFEPNQGKGFCLQHKFLDTDPKSRLKVLGSWEPYKP